MKPRITLNTFRRLSVAEEQIMRAVMPRTADADPSPLTSPILPSLAERRVWRAGRLVVEKAGFTLAEVVRG